jgi:CxxC-x17-CxxC domain-containing protein
MYNSHRDNKSGGFGGGRKFGGGQSWNRGSDDRGFAKPEMHNATCAECGNACQVPFKPNGRKPIYCSNCFKKEDKAGGDMRFEQRPSAGGFNAPEKRMFQTECDKCGDACEVPFRPTGERPVYCRGCFGKDGTQDRKSASVPSARPQGENYAEQFKALNAKLDIILKALNSGTTAKVAKEEIVAKEEVVPKVETPKASSKKKVAAKKKK